MRRGAGRERTAGADAHRGRRREPCRHCLDLIAMGEEKLVLSWRPFDRCSRTPRPADLPARATARATRERSSAGGSTSIRRSCAATTATTGSARHRTGRTRTVARRGVPRDPRRRERGVRARAVEVQLLPVPRRPRLIRGSRRFLQPFRQGRASAARAAPRRTWSRFDPAGRGVAPARAAILLCPHDAACAHARGRGIGATTMERLRDESGRVGYLVLYLMGVPVGLLILLAGPRQQHLLGGLICRRRWPPVSCST